MWWRGIGRPARPGKPGRRSTALRRSPEGPSRRDARAGGPPLTSTAGSERRTVTWLDGCRLRREGEVREKTVTQDRSRAQLSPPPSAPEVARKRHRPLRGATAGPPLIRQEHARRTVTRLGASLRFLGILASQGSPPPLPPVFCRPRPRIRPSPH